MRDLLEKWAELEPKRCRRGQGEPDPHFPTTFWIARKRPRPDGVVRFTEDGRLQIGGDEELLVAAIEAIEAHGWEWSLWSDGALAEATVTIPGEERRKFEKSGGGEPAVGLLMAYLEALEGQVAAACAMQQAPSRARAARSPSTSRR